MPGKSDEPVRPVLSWRVKLLGSIASLLVFIMFAELSLRVLGTNPQYKNQFFPVNRDIDFTEIYKKDPNLFWRFREGKHIDSRRFSYIDYNINSDGRRGPERTEQKQPGTFRVVALGNSCTFGWGVPYNNIWTTRLETSLHSRWETGDVEVINAGVPGYSSHQGLIYLRNELFDLDPDILLIMFGWNDHWSAGHNIPDAEQQPPSQWVLAVHNAVSPLKLYQFLRKVVLTVTDEEKEVRLDGVGTKRRVSLDEFYTNLISIIREARRHNVEPVLLIPPVASLEQYFAGTSSTLHSLHGMYQKEIHRVARREGVGLVDLQAAFDKDDRLYDDAQGDPVHFNARGHAVTAGAILEAIEPIRAGR